MKIHFEIDADAAQRKGLKISSGVAQAGKDRPAQSRERAGNSVSWFTNMPINRKLTMVILLTCTSGVLLLLAAVMIALRVVMSRRAMVENMTLHGRHPRPLQHRAAFFSSRRRRG